MPDATPPYAITKVFLALWPAASALPMLEAWRDGATWPQRAKPIQSERLHLTLHYIGAVPREHPAAMPTLLTVPCRPVEVLLTRAEVWDNDVAVLVPERVPAALIDLHSALAAKLAAAGLPVNERPYLPHVTLARNASGAALAHRPPAPLRFVEYILAESDRGYRVVHRFGG